MYDTFQTIKEAQAAYARKRTTQHFILTGELDSRCVCCGKPLNDFKGRDAQGKELHPEGYRSNRCEYRPQTKTFKLMHYSCAWGQTLTAIANFQRKQSE